MIVDLRSDTVTQPTPAMREAMQKAPLGDDVFGDDPSVNALQQRIAEMTGKEAALFLPSGTQSNLCALMAHCERGDEYIVGQHAHTYRYEGGGAAVLGSIQPQPLAQSSTGEMVLADIANAIKPMDCHFARTRLLALENTWNGHPMSQEYLELATTWPDKMACPRTSTGRVCSMRRWLNPPMQRCSKVSGVLLIALTAYPCVSAKAWVPPWARPCVDQMN